MIHFFSKTCFCYIGSHKILKILTHISFAIYSTSFLLKMTFLIRTFSIDLCIKYRCAFSLVLYVRKFNFFEIVLTFFKSIIALLVPLLQEKKIAQSNSDFETFFYTINLCGLKLENQIIKKSYQNIRISYIIFIIYRVLLNGMLIFKPII